MWRVSVPAGWVYLWDLSIRHASHPEQDHLSSNPNHKTGMELTLGSGAHIHCLAWYPRNQCCGDHLHPFQWHSHCQGIWPGAQLRPPDRWVLLTSRYYWLINIRDILSQPWGSVSAKGSLTRISLLLQILSFTVGLYRESSEHYRDSGFRLWCWLNPVIL